MDRSFRLPAHRRPAVAPTSPGPCPNPIFNTWNENRQKIFVSKFIFTHVGNSLIPPPKKMELLYIPIWLIKNQEFSGKYSSQLFRLLLNFS
jgi:hypothetical protein